MREWFSNIFGREIISHIGNFIFSAAAGITLTATKKIIAHSGHIGSTATMLAVVAAMESYRGSIDGPGDFVVTFATIVASILATDGLMHNAGIGRKHAIRNHVDNFHFLQNTPTNVDAIFPV